MMCCSQCSKSGAEGAEDGRIYTEYPNSTVPPSPLPTFENGGKQDDVLRIDGEGCSCDA